MQSVISVYLILKLLLALLIPPILFGYFFKVGIQKKLEMKLNISDVWYKAHTAQFYNF